MFWFIIRIMRQSEYQTQAYVNDGLNQQQAFDSPEGSAAIVHANKPEVDGTDIQKRQTLGKIDEKPLILQPLTPQKQTKTTVQHKSPVHTTKPSHDRKN